MFPAGDKKYDFTLRFELKPHQQTHYEHPENTIT
jgi:hypothetical protein